MSHPAPGVVPLPKPHVDDMLAMIDELRERVAAGEFETLWLIAWTPDHKLLSAERGKPKDRLWKIGAIECFKQDLITCMDTGEGSGL
jgi:hypothetical protein